MALELLQRGADALGVPLDADQIGRFERYAASIVRANARVNLTRIVDSDEIQVRHFLDSLTCALPLLPALRRGVAWHCIDVGSGAGLPGVPLVIAFPSLRMTLLEATAKKAQFLTEVVAELGLTTTKVVNGRAEESARIPKHRDRYDLVVARALAPLPVALEWCLPLVAVGGYCVLPRGSDLAEQLQAGRVAAGELGARLLLVQQIDAPGLPPGSRRGEARADAARLPAPHRTGIHAPAWREAGRGRGTTSTSVRPVRSRRGPRPW